MMDNPRCRRTVLPLLVGGNRKQKVSEAVTDDARSDHLGDAPGALGQNRRIRRSALG